MLVSTVTFHSTPHFLQPGGVGNPNAIHPATLAKPPIDKLLLPAGFVNAQAFGASTIARLPARQLTPAGFVNANIISPKTIQIDTSVAYETPSYANTGGTGNRTSIITV